MFKLYYIVFFIILTNSSFANYTLSPKTKMPQKGSKSREKKDIETQKAEENELIKYIQSGNKKGASHIEMENARKAFKILYDNNKKFIISVARQFLHNGIPLDDLINIGAMGLHEASKKFDTSRGLKFISYAVWWIKAHITRAIYDTSNPIKLPQPQQVLMKKMQKRIDANPNDLEAKEIFNYFNNIKNHHSLDKPLLINQYSSSNNTLGDSIPNKDFKSAEEVFIFSELNNQVLQAMKKILTPREQEILEGIYGLKTRRFPPLRELAIDFGISHERVRQIRDDALKKLKKYLKLQKNIILHSISTKKNTNMKDVAA